MAILKCLRVGCDFEQPFHETRRSVIRRDAQGRIVQEDEWTFDPATGKCIRDASDRTGRNQPYFRRCFGCFQNTGWVHSSEPTQRSSQWVPPAAIAAAHQAQAVANGQEAQPDPVWSVRRGGKTCECRGRCQLRGGGIGGCGCSKEGKACSVRCGCGGRGEDGDCLNPYTPPRNVDPPASKKCTCSDSYNGRCRIDRTRIGSQCGCAVLGVGCSDGCGCRGTCSNGAR